MKSSENNYNNWSSNYLIFFPTVRKRFLPYKFNIDIVGGWNWTTYFQYTITVPTAQYVYKKNTFTQKKNLRTKQKNKSRIKKNFLKHY